MTLERFPLIDDRLAGDANPRRQLLLRRLVTDRAGTMRMDLMPTPRPLDAAECSSMLDNIEWLRGDALQLLKVARDESIRSQVQLVRRDLEEARRWLESGPSEISPARIVNAILELAAARLERVSRRLSADGPGAKLTP